MAGTQKVQISIDRGGTFTDVHASIAGRPEVILKLLSVDPANYQDAPTEGIRRVLELATGESHPRGKPLDLKHVDRLRMGTTVATNALLERKGAASALLTTKGFKDLLHIGNQSRPKIFDLTVARPGVLYQEVVEANERIIPCTQASETKRYPQCRLVEGTTGERFRVLQELDMAAIANDLRELHHRGVRSIAVALLHSHIHRDHEKRIGELARSMGFLVALSSELQPMVKVVPRAESASADAYLTPVIKKYIDSIDSNFKGGLAAAGGCRFEFMQSDGGLVDFRNFSGLKAILSGPAAGVVGFAATSWDQQEQVPVIGFDMGGTSTDVCRFDGNFDHVFGASIAGVSIQSPQLDINTVAAGGGSILAWRNGLFVVGPESASAHPGPACYRKGGPLTVTDANLFLGRLLPEYFPKIFGPNEDEPLGEEITAQKFQELTRNINEEQRSRGQATFSSEEVAAGFLKVADESMARPIRNLTEARGFETSAHHLASFGGAGGQHACSVASTLGIRRIIVHKYSSVLSAYGLSLADVVEEAQEPANVQYITSQWLLRKKFESLTAQTTTALLSQGFEVDQMRHQLYLNMRYEGSDTSLMILKPPRNWDLASEFTERHRREFGFTFEKPLLVDDVRVRSTAASTKRTEKSPAAQLKEAHLKNAAQSPETTTIYFESTGNVEAPVYQLDKIEQNTKIQGPAMIIDETQTIVVSPDTTASILETCIIMDLNQHKCDEQRESAEPSSVELIPIDPVRLSIFGHRFMSIAEQMGRTLQKTSVSTNIKERLDFSCALFSPDGGLVANAPHVPVHLGSMQFAVKYQHKRWSGQLKDGDVLVSNHPSCGGTHLPDITVITPVFDRPGGTDIVFYVASRGHHADIGGIRPGSMPSESTELWQEGAAIEADKIVSNGVFNEERMTKLLLHEPSKYDGCSGTRCLGDNLSDLKAQIAANTRGIQLIHNLISEYGLVSVQAYMYAIQSTAETAVRNLLRDLHTRFDGKPLQATDYMDDGTPIQLQIQIDATSGSAIFDFTGTGAEVYGNTNAPVAITHSAIIYCLRCMINSDIPLNQGCLNPVSIHIPPNSLLSPSSGAAVVGGNVLTSQRITDVVLKAFHACAASQGDTNNLTFGTGGKSTDGKHVDGFGYYETIAGGAGAGPSWEGTSGVHTHMTNTCITDPEILENRYPCILRQFTLREGSGGEGAKKGGNGVVREIEFLDSVQCSILSERRVHRPYGMEGGGKGQAGLNLWITKDEKTGEERRVNLGGKNTVNVKNGDRIVVMTPGGGGWGSPVG